MFKATMKHCERQFLIREISEDYPNERGVQNKNRQQLSNFNGTKESKCYFIKGKIPLKIFKGRNYVMRFILEDKVLMSFFMVDYK